MDDVSFGKLTARILFKMHRAEPESSLILGMLEAWMGLEESSDTLQYLTGYKLSKEMMDEALEYKQKQAQHGSRARKAENTNIDSVAISAEDKRIIEDYTKQLWPKMPASKKEPKEKFISALCAEYNSRPFDIKEGLAAAEWHYIESPRLSTDNNDGKYCKSIIKFWGERLWEKEKFSKATLPIYDSIVRPFV